VFVAQSICKSKKNDCLLICTDIFRIFVAINDLTHMKGLKELVLKMMYQVHIDDLVPQNNFYRLLDAALDLHFLYKATERYYGDEGCRPTRQSMFAQYPGTNHGES